jgi:hypothetical protein
MRQVEEIRIQKAKPKLGDILKYFKSQGKKFTNKADQEFIIGRIKVLYDTGP